MLSSCSYRTYFGKLPVFCFCQFNLIIYAVIKTQLIRGIWLTCAFFLEGFIIVMGLSIHSIFEGMAIGLGDSASDVWKLLAAVASHKLVISFCIGLEMSVTGISLAMHSCYMLVFCIATPLGTPQNPQKIFKTPKIRKTRENPKQYQERSQ